MRWSVLSSFFLIFRGPPSSTLFPYTTLFRSAPHRRRPVARSDPPAPAYRPAAREDRKSTRLNSSHTVISYAVFCLKKKKFLDDHTCRSGVEEFHVILLLSTRTDYLHTRPPTL